MHFKIDRIVPDTIREPMQRAPKLEKGFSATIALKKLDSAISSEEHIAQTK